MDRNTQDRESELPSKRSQDELEEALKWLEELTSRKGKVAEQPSSSVPSATIESPFRGLIESDEGDLPDWLREAPSLPNLESVAETETESRLDWLAKMAQRESIEELPTLEWRRLGEPMQSALLPPAREGTPDISEASIEAESEIPETPTAMEDESGKLETSAPLTEIPSSSDPLSPPGEEDEEIEALIPEATRDLPASLEIDPQLDLEFDAEDELPSLDDLDAAMAWIEELAASQDAPVEDIPSIVDRALASRLMMEASASQSASPLDELGSESDMMTDLTPTHPFIEEEDFADTVVLVETMAAEQGLPVEVPEAIGETDIDEFKSINIPDPEEREAIIESVIVDEIPDLETPPDALSFEEAMAYLDEMAVQQEHDLESDIIADAVDMTTADESAGDDEEFIAEGIEVAAESEVLRSEVVEPKEGIEIEPETVTAELPVSDFTPWEDGLEVTDSGIVRITPDAGAISSPAADLDMSTLESALMSLDALALPTGKTLDDIDASLRVAQIAPVRDVSSALDWLESTLAKEETEAPASQTELDEEALIARMPEDPDEVLAWLEQMSDEETAVEESRVVLEDESATFTTGDHATEPLIEEMAEADLLDMPEDPDEAMAWLEGLARGETGTRDRAVEEETGKIEEPEEIVPELEATEVEESAVEVTAAEEIVVEVAETGEIEEIAAEVLPIPAEEFVADVAPVTEQPATAKPRRRRAKPAKTQVESTVEEVSPIAEELAGAGEPAAKASVVKLVEDEVTEEPAGAEEPAMEEEPVATPPARERPDFSWVDLLKPLN